MSLAAPMIKERARSFPTKVPRVSGAQGRAGGAVHNILGAADRVSHPRGGSPRSSAEMLSSVPELGVEGPKGLPDQNTIRSPTERRKMGCKGRCPEKSWNDELHPLLLRLRAEVFGVRAFRRQFRFSELRRAKEEEHDLASKVLAL